MQNPFLRVVPQYAVAGKPWIRAKMVEISELTQWEKVRHVHCGPARHGTVSKMKINKPNERNSKQRKCNVQLVSLDHPSSVASLQSWRSPKSKEPGVPVRDREG